MIQPDITDAIGLRDRALLETIYSTGLRRLEIINLKLYDLQFDRGLVVVREGKGKKDPYVPVQNERSDETTDLRCRLAGCAEGVSESRPATRRLCSLSGADGRQAHRRQAPEERRSRVLEVVTDHRGDTFRTVYTVKLEKAVYVLHAFQKKFKHGIATPKSVMDLVKQRLERAIEIDHELEK